MSTKTTFKRIALVAVASLGFGVLSSVAPASAATLTGTVSPIRVSFTTLLQTTTQDATPQAQISWTSAAVHTGADTVSITLTTAPDATALVQIDNADEIGTVLNAWGSAGAAGTASLTSAGGSVGVALANQTTTNGKVALQANTSGTYAGNLKVHRAGVLQNQVNFSFTTRGTVASYTAAVTASSVSPSGTSTHSVTLKDSAGSTTQPLLVDSFALEATTGTIAASYTASASVLTSGAYAVAASSLVDGVASTTFTASSVANTASVITATAAGTLGGLAAQDLTVTTDATVVDPVAVTQMVLTAPADAALATGTLAAGTRAQAVRTGTSAVTVKATHATAGSVLRFSAAASAGTVDGVAYTTTQYKNATVNSLGYAYVSFTLGGNATLLNATLTVNQVTVANAAVSLTTFTVTQTAAAAVAGTITTDLGASLVRALAATTSINVTVEDQYGAALGSGWTVQSFRGTTLLSTGTTNASGVATVTVSPLSTVVTGGSETYTYQASYPGISAITATETTVVTYTTSGGITSMSTALTGQSGTAVLTPVLHSTLATALTKLASIYVPTAGYIEDQTGTSLYTVSTGVNTIAGESDSIELTNTNVPANSTTYTADAGALICDAADCDIADGVSSLVVSSTGSAFVFARTTGVHTITATSGDKTTTIKFHAYNAATDYYTLSAAADSTSITTGQTGVVTITVKDLFGNVVDTTGSLLTATASGKVRLAGQALSQTVDSAVDGTFAFTVLADATAGSGTLTIAPTTTGANAWSSAYEVLTGYSAPVKSVTLTFTVTGATLKTTDDAVAAANAATAAAEKAGTDAVAAANAATAAAVAASAAAVAAANAATAEAAKATAAATAASAAAVAASAAAQAAAVAASEAAADAAAEATDAANAATDAANASAEAGDAATAAAQDAADAVAALSTQVSEMISALKAQLTALTNLVIKIQKKVKA